MVSWGPAEPLAGIDLSEAAGFLRSHDSWVVDRQMELTAIPAPPFEEGPRGVRFAELFREVGLQRISTDEVGNVLGWYPAVPPHPDSNGSPDTPEPPLVVSAHLDTVFPPGTDVQPRISDGRIIAPGISDDGRGLAATLALARVFVELKPTVANPVLFVGTVGEEGPGDLRGVRHLVGAAPAILDTLGFISLDGVGMDRIITRGVGSTRFRLTLQGSGGHSWTDFGRANPIHALGAVVSRAQDLAISSEPRTTLTVARWGGGNSINAIPEDAWVEMDLRSEDGEKLEALEASVLAILEEEAGRPKASGILNLSVEYIGRRPAGRTPEDHPLVLAAKRATTMLGCEARSMASSTDANYPMSLGIPSITLGAGGRAGGIHTLAEWYENTLGPEGILRALLTALLFLEGG